MKGNKKLLIITILLLVITIGFTTYAIYKTSLSGTGTVTAATWNVSFADGQTTISENFNIQFSSSDCNQANNNNNNNHVVEGKIAPGVTCSKTIDVNATGTEVDVLLTAAKSGNITATKGGDSVAITNANEFTVGVTTNPANGIIAYNAQTKTATVTVSVAWGSDEGDEKDPYDTALNGATITVPITLTAKQYLGS